MPRVGWLPAMDEAGRGRTHAALPLPPSICSPWPCPGLTRINDVATSTAHAVVSIEGERHVQTPAGRPGPHRHLEAGARACRRPGPPVWRHGGAAARAGEL